MRKKPYRVILITYVTPRGYKGSRIPSHFTGAVYFIQGDTAWQKPCSYYLIKGRHRHARTGESLTELDLAKHLLPIRPNDPRLHAIIMELE